MPPGVAGCLLGNPRMCCDGQGATWQVAFVTSNVTPERGSSDDEQAIAT